MTERIPSQTVELGAVGEPFAEALALIARLPLTDAEKVEAVRRLLVDHDARGKPFRGPGLTVTEAARQHLDDVDGLTLPRAKTRIVKACARGHIVSAGKGRAHRIDPDSLAVWRLRQRERNLDRCDDGSGGV